MKSILNLIIVIEYNKKLEVAILISVKLNNQSIISLIKFKICVPLSLKAIIIFIHKFRIYFLLQIEFVNKKIIFNAN